MTTLSPRPVIDPDAAAETAELVRSRRAQVDLIENVRRDERGLNDPPGCQVGAGCITLVHHALPSTPPVAPSYAKSTAHLASWWRLDDADPTRRGGRLGGH